MLGRAQHNAVGRAALRLGVGLGSGTASSTVSRRRHALLGASLRARDRPNSGQYPRRLRSPRDSCLISAVSILTGRHFANFGFHWVQLFARRRGPRNVAAAPAFPGHIAGGLVDAPHYGRFGIPSGGGCPIVDRQ